MFYGIIYFVVTDHQNTVLPCIVLYVLIVRLLRCSDASNIFRSAYQAPTAKAIFRSCVLAMVDTVWLGISQADRRDKQQLMIMVGRTRVVLLVEVKTTPSVIDASVRTAVTPKR